MQDNEPYEQLLGLKVPWKATTVALRMEESNVTVSVSHEGSARLRARNADGRRRSTVIDILNDRNRARFQTAILFHTDGLSLMPAVG